MQLIRLPEVLGIVPVSKATLYRMVQNDEFPAPVKIGKHLSAWRKDEIERWAEDPSAYTPRPSKRDLSGII